MKIGIDISSATPARTGIGHAAHELAKRLARCPEHEVVLVFNSLRQQPPAFAQRRGTTLRRRSVPGPALLAGWRFAGWPPVETLAGRVDLFHSPATFIPPQRSGACVTTVHDLDFLDTPGGPVRPLGSDYIAWVLGSRLGRVDAFLCPSRRTAESLLRHFGRRDPGLAARIHVVPWGVESRFFRPPEVDVGAIRRGAWDGRPYLLAVGDSAPRKDLQGLLRAHAILRAARPDAPGLLLVGVRDDELPADARATATVRGLGYVPRNQLPGIYQGAEAFVCASRMEGFGLPLLEAMAAGTPVVTTDAAGCLEFVTSASALAVPPAEPEALAAAMDRVLGDPVLRAGLTAAGRASARSLTWGRCARETLRVYAALR